MAMETSQGGRSPPASQIQVAHEGQAVLMQVVGLGNMNISLTLNDFATSSLQEGYKHFALDLAQCRGMDSTFMGTISGMQTEIKNHGGWICLLNVSEYNRKLLETIGLWRLISVKEEFPIDPVETQQLESVGNATRRLAHIRKAHEELVAIDERNRERFGRFLAALEEDMKESGK